MLAHVFPANPGHGFGGLFQAEVAEELDLPQHVLRFWESKFTQLKPLKRRGGRRYYRPEDVLLLQRIRGLLYGDGYTIRGVQKLLRQGFAKPPADGDAPTHEQALASEPHEQALASEPDETAAEIDAPAARLSAGEVRRSLQEILAALEEVRALLGHPLR